MFSYLINTLPKFLILQKLMIIYSMFTLLTMHLKVTILHGSSVPVGKNHLSKMVKDMCSQAKIEGKKTNHSLRASGITTLFQAGVSEKVIQDWSGHR